MLKPFMRGPEWCRGAFLERADVEFKVSVDVVPVDAISSSTINGAGEWV